MNRRSSYSKFGVRTDAKGKADRTRDGILFGSKLERVRHDELKLLERAKAIVYVRRQVPFTLLAWSAGLGRSVEVGKYIADFCYFDTKLKRDIVEDVKGMRTPIYQFKKKMMQACYGIEIHEWPERPKKVRKTRVKR